MLNKIRIKNINDLFGDLTTDRGEREKINCLSIDADTVATHLAHPQYLNALIAILVLSGTSRMSVNYKTYSVASHTMILLTFSHLFYFDECSPDFSCKCMLVSKNFMDEMDATDMIYRRIKYGARLYNQPIVSLSDSNVSLLQERIRAVDLALDNVRHSFYKEMILNSLFAFYLDLSHIIEQHSNLTRDSNLSRYENIIKSFIELLVTNYREEHKVEFYASRLHITPHYLTLIVKKITGQTVNEFIFEMLYAEARNLLTHSRLSVQEIAHLLHFSDQSSLGKFFKRKSGISPAEYRKGKSRV
ncbi:AraC family transcriptional regulator [Porphyromonadaceae bacterium OttesenSCG-928-L07]|nr:AraC family transcriptional regulator [Porphyromonadaceae bacterium OttesenSCG-928-L07]MDL2251545.1 AraC family transcriptional regulator [Odoribacter sp. OttesenSCG-928-J03]MDL2331083.1 AraC family transcriptional regulator [Odoribacter sp. OttesenSCG-928-A06]